MNVFQSVVFFIGLGINFSLLTALAESSEKYQVYFLAHYNQLEQRNDKAQLYYDYLLKNYNTPHLYPGLLFHLAQTGQHQSIVKLIPYLEAHKKNDVQIEMLLINSLQAVNNGSEAAKRLIALSKKNPENAEINFFAASMHAENNRFSQALECIDAYLNHNRNFSKNFIFYFLKAQIYSRIGNYPLAKVSIKKCLELSPTFDQGWLLLGLINELSGDLDEAVTSYKSSLKLLGPNPLLEHQIMQLQMKQQHALQSDNRFFKDALEAYNKNEYQKALHMVTTAPNKETHIPTCLLTIEILCKLNKIQEALSFLQKKMEIDFSNDTWYRAAHLLYKAGVPAKSILDLYSYIEKKHVTATLPLLYKADIYLRSNDTKNAQIYLSKAEGVVTDSIVKTRILYQLALLHYEARDFDTMHNYLLKGKNLNQDFPPLLNLLAYYYATNGKNLKEAEILIGTALKKDKNQHFQETRALILYKQKKYNQAEKILTTLSKKMPRDATVLYWLAKTIYRKGNIQAAHTTLQQAINFCTLSSDKDKYKKCLQKWGMEQK